MLFEIGFNEDMENENFILETLGATLHPTGAEKYGPFEVHKLEINTLSDIEALLKEVNKLTEGDFDALINFESRYIFFE